MRLRAARCAPGSSDLWAAGGGELGSWERSSGSKSKGLKVPEEPSKWRLKGEHTGML